MSQEAAKVTTPARALRNVCTGPPVVLTPTLRPTPNSDVRTSCFNDLVDASVLVSAPDRIERPDVAVMERSTVDDLAHIQTIWPEFERLVGLRGRKMYARADERLKTYTVCTPIKGDDDPDALGLQTGTLPGGVYLRGRLTGEPPSIYERIMPGIQELRTLVGEMDASRPLIEFYRRHDQIELWVPIR